MGGQGRGGRTGIRGRNRGWRGRGAGVEGRQGAGRFENWAENCYQLHRKWPITDHDDTL